MITCIVLSHHVRHQASPRAGNSDFRNIAAARSVLLSAKSRLVKWANSASTTCTIGMRESETLPFTTENHVDEARCASWLCLVALRSCSAKASIAEERGAVQAGIVTFRIPCHSLKFTYVFETFRRPTKRS